MQEEGEPGLRRESMNAEGGGQGGCPEAQAVHLLAVKACKRVYTYFTRRLWVVCCSPCSGGKRGKRKFARGGAPTRAKRVYP